MASICQDHLASVYGPPKKTAGRKNEGGPNSDMAYSRPWVSKMGGEAPAELEGPSGWASGRPQQTLQSAWAAALPLPQEQPAAQDSQAPGRCSLSLEGQQTCWQHPQSYLQLSLKVKQSTTVPDITLPDLGKPPNSVAGKQRSPWMV